MNLLRRELKFQIPTSMVDDISRFIAPYCDLDHYSSIMPDNYYVINSLYFDTASMLFLERKRLNMSGRFSMRLRSYGSEPKYPAFFEVKSKINQWVHKKRGPISSPATVEFLREGTGGMGNKDLNNPYLREICAELIQKNITPKLMTNYERKAYFGKFEPYSRVTFDRRMRCYPETGYNIFPDNSKFANYDHDNQYSAEGSEVVLELKCETKVPDWMFAMVQHFELKHEQFSKFDSSFTFQNDFQYKSEAFSMAPGLLSNSKYSASDFF